jgi:hypothetical protein
VPNAARLVAAGVLASGALALGALALGALAPGALARAGAQPPRAPQVKTEYDEYTDSTTRSLSAYVLVDTSVAPPDTFAVELRQRWKGRGTTAPVAPVELGLGRTLAPGRRATRSLMGTGTRRPTVTLQLDGARRIRLERSEYVSNAGDTMTFETARYWLSAADLRRVAECNELRVWLGDRELWVDQAWRRVAADMVAGQAR